MAFSGYANMFFQHYPSTSSEPKSQQVIFSNSHLATQMTKNMDYKTSLLGNISQPMILNSSRDNFSKKNQLATKLTSQFSSDLTFKNFFMKKRLRNFSQANDTAISMRQLLKIQLATLLSIYNDDGSDLREMFPH